jgi:hypothetical protein
MLRSWATDTGGVAGLASARAQNWVKKLPGWVGDPALEAIIHLLQTHVR